VFVVVMTHSSFNSGAEGIAAPPEGPRFEVVYPAASTGDAQQQAPKLSGRLMVVLGHGRCGAVKAAIRSFQTGEPAPGHIGAVVRALRPAYEAAIRQSGDLLDNTIRAQIKLTVRQLRHDPLLHPMVRSGHLQVRGGLYGMVSGAVGIIA